MHVSLRTRVATRLHRARRRVRDVAVGGDPDPRTVREDVARRYVRGSGVEIGALHRPLRVPPGASVRYVDRLTADELRRRYPEYAHQWIVDPDILDDGETLASVGDGELDFVIANHVLEHMENPVGTLRTYLRVLRPGGVAFLAVPDKRHTFDGARPSTPIEHVLRDDADGPDWSRAAHYEEYARLAEHVPEEGVAERARALESERCDIHFHVWTLPELVRLLLHLREREDFPFELELVQGNDNEALVILRRS